MTRRLIVCCDGTWNDPADNTNVFKIKNAIDTGVGLDEVEQLPPYYHEGVGNDLLSKVSGGVFGRGLSANVQHAYRWLVETYQPGDQLWFFGFSRGAFTARSLVGFIRKVGLLPREHVEHTREGYDIYRQRDDDKDPRKRGVNSAEAIAFRKRYETRLIENLDIRFVGVWDTVGALGMPVFGPRSFLARRRWSFHDARLSSYVQHARQALAVDEHRVPFLATLWEIPEAKPGDEAEAARRAAQTVEQHWFAGCHSDIGGHHGQHALGWMMREARDQGLRFKPNTIPESRPPQVIHDSMSMLFRPMGEAIRPIGQPGYTKQQLDGSVVARLSADYSPENVSRFMEGRPLTKVKIVHKGLAFPWLSRLYLRQFEARPAN